MDKMPVLWREIARRGEEHLNDRGYVCHEQMIPLSTSIAWIPVGNNFHGT